MCDTESCEPGCPVKAVRAHGAVTRGRGEDASRFYTVLRHPKAGREVPVVNGALRHATPKPRGVMGSLIQLTTSPGDLVLNPFAGIVTTIEGAVSLGRRAVGIEIDPRNAGVAQARLERVGVELDVRKKGRPLFLGVRAENPYRSLDIRQAGGPKRCSAPPECGTGSVVG